MGELIIIAIGVSWVIVLWYLDYHHYRRCSACGQPGALVHTNERKKFRHDWHGLLSKEYILMRCKDCGCSEWRRYDSDVPQASQRSSVANFPPLSGDVIVKTKTGYLIGKREFEKFKDAEECLYHTNVDRELKRRRFETRDEKLSRKMIAASDLPLLSSDEIRETGDGYMIEKHRFAKREDAEAFLYHTNVEREMKRWVLEHMG